MQYSLKIILNFIKKKFIKNVLCYCAIRVMLNWCDTKRKKEIIYISYERKFSDKKEEMVRK